LDFSIPAPRTTVILKFNLQNRHLAQEFVPGIKVQGGSSAIDENMFDKEKFSFIKESLKIHDDERIVERIGIMNWMITTTGTTTNNHKKGGKYRCKW